MNKFIIVVVVVLVLAGGVYFIANRDNSSGTPQTSNPPSPSPVATPPASPPASSPTPTPTPNPTPTPTPATSPTTHKISIQNFAFDQSSITVKKGDTIVWTNKDSAPHTVTGDLGTLVSQTLNTNGTYSFTFNTVGTVSYHCAFHPSMKATVVVTQ